jgi:putative ABC transport system permease protein
LVEASSVSPGYFHLLGIPLAHGRLFTDQDNENAPLVAIVNEAFARTWWPNENPVGKRVKLSGLRAATSWTTVVGVVADARTESLEEADVPQIYKCSFQLTDDELVLFVRGRLDPVRIPDEARVAVQSINPELPVFGAVTLPGVVSGSLSQRRFSMEMVLLFALTALLLAALGIYGTISYLVNERTHEIGIRLALGAKTGEIMRMILRQGLALAIAGAALGLVGALIISHLMAGLLYGVMPTDPLTFVGVTFVLTGVALAACYIPARRAMRVDPMIALRQE